MLVCRVPTCVRWYPSSHSLPLLHCTEQTSKYSRTNRQKVHVAHTHTLSHTDVALLEAAGRWSVVLEQRQQIVAAVVGKVWRTQVGQQLVWVGQLRKKLQTQKGKRSGL